MKGSAKNRRFRINPVEVVIFSAVFLILCNSVYSLFNERNGFQPAMLSPMAANPVSETRAPASTSQSFLNVDFNCQTQKEMTTSAPRIRLTGPLCGSSDSTGTQLIKTVIHNDANKFTATVFTDVNSGRFSTDYIPLNSEKNPIRVEFLYKGGKTVTNDFVVTRQ